MLLSVGAESPVMRLGGPNLLLLSDRCKNAGLSRSGMGILDYTKRKERAGM